MVDKRSHARYAISIPVTLIVAGAEYPGHTRDVSLGGLFVVTQAKLSFAAEIEVRLVLPAMKEASVLGATGRWHHDGGMGLCFKSLRAREVWGLNQLFKTGVAEPR